MSTPQEQLDEFNQKEEKRKETITTLYETIPLNHRRKTVDDMTARSKDQIKEIIENSQEARDRIHQANKDLLNLNRSESKKFLAEVEDFFAVAGGIEEFTKELKKTNASLESHIIKEQEKKPFLSKIAALFRSGDNE